MNAVWCFVLLSVTIVAGKPNGNTWTIPEEFVPKLVKASADCTDELGLETVDILPKYFAGELEDSELIRKYMYCIGTKAGYVDVNGKLLKDKIAKAYGEHKEKIGSVVDECNKAKYNDKYETSFRAYECFHKNSGLKIKL